jgi:CSLREA domain-containing protein
MAGRVSGRWAAVGALVLVSAAAPAPAAAKTYRPTLLGDPAPGACGHHDCSLREAISAANARPGADRVLLKSGKVYKLALTGALEDANATGDLDVTDQLTLEASGKARATVDAQSLDRVIDAVAGLTVRRLTIKGGNVTSDRAGGIDKTGPGELLVEDSVIQRNEGYNVAGIYVDALDGATISGSRIVHNTAPGAAGGVDVQGGTTLLIRHSTIAHNSAASGAAGGLHVVGKAKLVETRVLNNEALLGGGIAVLGGVGEATLVATRSTIAGNTSTSTAIGGGGIANIDGSVTLKSSTVSGNHSHFNGGGILNLADQSQLTATLTVVDSTVAGNDSTAFGGGIDSFTTGAGVAANVSLNGATIAYNDSDSDSTGGGQGGGIENGTGSGTFAVKNSLIALNSGTVGPDCAGFPFVSGGGNLLTSAADCMGFAADIADPIPKIATLAGNGGPTKTIALKKGSPAINQAGATAPKRDQRGVKRKDPDIGAYERV